MSIRSIRYDFSNAIRGVYPSFHRAEYAVTRGMVKVAHAVIGFFEQIPLIGRFFALTEWGIRLGVSNTQEVISVVISVTQSIFSEISAQAGGRGVPLLGRVSRLYFTNPFRSIFDSSFFGSEPPVSSMSHFSLNQLQTWLSTNVAPYQEALHRNISQWPEKHRVAKDQFRQALNRFLPNSSVEYVTASELGRIQACGPDIELDRSIFRCNSSTGVQDVIRGVSIRNDELHLFGLASQINTAEATGRFTPLPGGAMAASLTDNTQGPLAQRTNPKLFELVNAFLANKGFNMLAAVLSGAGLETAYSHGYLTDQNYEQAVALVDCFRLRGSYFEVPCFKSFPENGGRNPVYLIPGAAPAYGRYAAPPTSTQHGEVRKQIQYYAALASYHTHFNQTLKLARENPSKLIIYHATGVGVGVFENDPETVGRAFKDAANFFQAQLLRENQSRISSQGSPLRVRVQIDSFGGSSNIPMNTLIRAAGLEPLLVAPLAPTDFPPARMFRGSYGPDARAGVVPIPHSTHRGRFAPRAEFRGRTREEHGSTLPRVRPPRPEPLPLPVLTFSEKIVNLIEAVKVLAPNRNEAIPVQIVGSGLYYIWFDKTQDAINIQVSADYSNPIDAQRLRNILAVWKNPGAATSLKFLFNGDPEAAECPAEYVPIIEGLYPQVATLKKNVELRDSLRSSFNNDCLRLLYTYLKGPLARDFRYDPSITDGPRSQLTLGAINERNNMPSDAQVAFDAWVAEGVSSGDESRLNSVDNISCWMTEYGGYSVINLQMNWSYVLARQDAKLGIKLDAEGNIISLYVDGWPEYDPQDADPANHNPEAIDRHLLDPDSVWNKRLTVAIQKFLTERALKSSGSNTQIHALTLQHRPEDVLEVCCRSGVFRPGRISFMRPDLTDGPGIDAGGPFRQFVGDLAGHLFDGSQHRRLLMDKEREIPVISREISLSLKEEQRQFYSNIGKFLSACYESSGGMITGRVFNDAFLNLLKFVIPFGTTPPTEPQLLEIVKSTIKDPAGEDRWTVMLLGYLEKLERGELLEEDETAFLEIILVDDSMYVMEGTSSVKDIKASIIRFLLHKTGQGSEAFGLGLAESILAAHLVAQGLSTSLRTAISAIPARGTTAESEQTRRYLQTLRSISSRIQGEPLDRGSIAAKVYYSGSHPVIMAKVNWLKEMIQDNTRFDDDWIRKLLRTITGRNTVTASTRLEITPSYDEACHAHTCFSSIEIPTVHTNIGIGEVPTNDKDRFRNNLAMTMSQTEFDSG